MKTKRNGLILLGLLLAAFANAGIDYEISSGYFGAIALRNDDTLNMTGGWGESISSSGISIADIYATDTGKQVGIVTASSSSILNIYGGTIGEIELTNSNLTTIKGGNIGTLICSQDVREDGPEGAVIPRTYLYVSEWSYNDTTMLLTGKWEDLTPFSIQLEDKYSISTFDNLLFIPEPTSLVLFGLASLVLRKRK